jgi:RND superfamily putative drug exporter
MELLGDRNWWLPRWLDRLLPRLDVEGDVAHEAPVPIGETGAAASEDEARVPVA